MEELSKAVETTTLDDDDAIKFVDTVSGVKAMIDTLKKDDTKEVAIDFEGVDLCRSGELCIMQLSDGKSTWLIDVTTLGEGAFGDGGLRDLLQNPEVLKVGYDGRADNDALYNLHASKLVGFYDVQIASCNRQDAEECRRDRFVHGLVRAIGRFLKDDPERAETLRKTKEMGLALFAPEKGGSYEVWKERPLKKSLVEYAAADVALLLEMKRAWIGHSSMRDNLASAAVRINKAAMGPMPAKGRHMAKKDF